jgi:hypothetical protein
MKEVDVVIISWAKDEALHQVTKNGLDTLFESEENVIFHAYVVETNPEVNYDEYNTEDNKNSVTTLRPELPFGYHKFLNQGRKAGKSKYVVLSNNDLTYEKRWASKIIELMEGNPQIKSASPWCPQTQKDNSQHKNKAYIGYRVRGELAGWCIFQQRDIYEIYPNKELDETFTHWYCDNDYAMTLQANGIKHALVCDSIVNHHDQMLGETHKIHDEEYQKKTTHGQQQVFMNKWANYLQSQTGPR